MNKFKQRPMSSQDVDAVLEIEESSFRISPWSGAGFKRFIDKPERFACVICDDAEVIVGYYLVELKEEHLLLWKMAVHPEYERQGIGTQILGMVKKLATSKEHNVIKLNVRHSNIGAFILYHNNGFVVTDIKTEGYPEKDGVELTASGRTKISMRFCFQQADA